MNLSAKTLTSVKMQDLLNPHRLSVASTVFASTPLEISRVNVSPVMSCSSQILDVRISTSAPILSLALTCFPGVGLAQFAITHQVGAICLKVITVAALMALRTSRQDMVRIL